MKLSKKFRATLLGAALAGLVGISAVVSYAYDGNTDPVISLSYLNQFKQQQIDPQISALQDTVARLEAQIAFLQNSSGATQPQNPVVDYGYTIEELKKGDRVLALEACDIMLRSGTATAISPYDSQGLSDYTDGAEVMNGDAVKLNHMMIIPRGDGRGILITSDVAYIMIRGEYSLES